MYAYSLIFTAFKTSADKASLKTTLEGIEEGISRGLGQSAPFQLLMKSVKEQIAKAYTFKAALEK